MLYATISLIIMIIVTSVKMIINCSTPFVMPANKNILIMGHSHTEGAINDAILKRSINLSNAARPLTASCNYINKITIDNPHIDTVLLAINANLISSLETKFMWNKNRKISNSMLFLGSINQDANYCMKNPYIFCSLLFSGFYIGNNSIGSFQSSKRNKLNLDLQLHHNTFPLKAEIDTTLYEYQKLLATKKLLDLRGVHLILVDTPKYNPGNQMIEQIKFHTLLKEYLPEFDYIDYVSFPLPNDCYGDVTHLNYKGAELFSRYLQENGIAKYNSNN